MNYYYTVDGRSIFYKMHKQFRNSRFCNFHIGFIPKFSLEAKLKTLLYAQKNPVFIKWDKVKGKLISTIESFPNSNWIKNSHIEIQSNTELIEDGTKKYCSIVGYMKISR